MIDAAAALELGDGRSHDLRDRLTIGRGPGNQLRIDARSVSREHAELVWANARWAVEDRGSANGTFVNGVRVAPGIRHPLRHGDRLRLGTEELVFSWPAERDDPDRTDELEGPAAVAVSFSPFQLQVVSALCGAWLGESLDRLPTNREIAERLGTPEAEDAVKAALRRVYAKAGLAQLTAAEKRRALCRLARQGGWISPG